MGRLSWRFNPALDFAFMVPALAWIFAAPPTSLTDQAGALFGLTGAVVAILCAVAAFAATSLSQSTAPQLVRARSRYGRDLRVGVGHSVGWTAAAALAMIPAFVLVYLVGPQAGFVLGSAALLLGSAKTARAAFWINVIMQAEDQALPKADHTDGRYTLKRVNH